MDILGKFSLYKLFSGGATTEALIVLLCDFGVKCLLLEILNANNKVIT